MHISYGGWMEDREALWRGTYLDETKSYIHLGIDFNVPYRTPIAMPSNCKAIRVDSDVPEEGGWGTRVIVKLDNEPIFLIFAHLDPAVSVSVDDLVVAGTQFALVGCPPLNGGWFPHLHVQAVQANYFEILMKDNLQTLDGYGHKKDLETLMKAFPDPMQYLSRIP